MRLATFLRSHIPAFRPAMPAILTVENAKAYAERVTGHTADETRIAWDDEWCIFVDLTDGPYIIGTMVVWVQSNGTLYGEY